MDEVVEGDVSGNPVVDGTGVRVTARSYPSNPNLNSTPITYSLTNDAGGRFKINSVSGVISANVSATNTNKINFESATSHTVSVIATNSAGSSLPTDFTINVKNAPPTTPIDTNTANNTIAENSPGGTVVSGLALSSTDPNGGSVSYQFAPNGNPNGKFEISGNTVRTAASASFDYESTPNSFNIKVRAIDPTGGTTGTSGETTLTISVGDVNEPPSGLQDSDATTTNQIPEDVAANDVYVGITLTATDPEGRPLTYTFVTTGGVVQDGGGAFKIDPSNWKVLVKDFTKINREVNGTHTVQVEARDDGNNAITKTFTITVLNVAPGSSSDTDLAANSVSEDAADNTLVGIDAQATDPKDSPNVYLTYSLINDAGGRFKIDSNGVVRVRKVPGGPVLDYETATSVPGIVNHKYKITVRASDPAPSKYSDTDFFIDVTDANDPPGPWTGTPIAISEDVDSSSDGVLVVMTANAPDPEGTAVTYALTNDAGGRFTIESASGVVKLANASLINWETNATHNITVQATDSAVAPFTPLSSTQSFTITITNKAPSKPLDTDSADNRVLETATAGDVVGVKANASDPKGPNVIYSLTNDAGGRFQIDSGTGIVSVASWTGLGPQFDVTAATKHTITVQAKDSTNPGYLTSSESFDISVVDVLTVTVTSPDSLAKERGGDPTGTYKVTRNTLDLSQPLTVNFTMSGTANEGSDFSLDSSSSVVIPAGSADAIVTLTATPDLDMEGTETAVLTLGPGLYVLSANPANSTASITIKDSPHVRVDATKNLAFEQATKPDMSFGPRPGEYTITLVNPSTGPVNVSYTLSGSANSPASGGPSSPQVTSDKDYDLSASSGLSVAMVSTISLTPVVDPFNEAPYETATMTLTDTGDYVIESGFDVATVAIFDLGITLVELKDGSLVYPIHLSAEGECDCSCHDGEENDSPSEEVSLDYRDSTADPTKTYAVKVQIPAAAPGASNSNNTNTNSNSNNTNPGSFALPGSNNSPPPGNNSPPPPAASSPSKLKVVVSMSNRADVVQGASYELYYDIVGHAVGDEVQFGFSADLSALATNVYKLKIGVQTIFADGSTSPEVEMMVNQGVANTAQWDIPTSNPSQPLKRPDAGVGRGVMLRHFKQIREEQDGVWYSPGDGELYWFEKAANGTYPLAMGVDGSLTKVNGVFTLTDKYFTRSRFDNYGRVVTETDRNERVTNYSYRSDGQISGITDPFGVQVKFDYDSLNRLISITDRDGIVHKTGYDSTSGQLDWIESADPDAVGTGRAPYRKGLIYTSDGRLERVKTTENGATKWETEFTRDDRKNVASKIHHDETDSSGAPASWGFVPIASNDKIVKTSDPNLGTVTAPAPIWVGELEGRLEEDGDPTERYQINWAGQVIRSAKLTDAGTELVTHSEYDFEGRRTAEELPTVIFSDGTTQTLRYEYTFDERDNLTQIKITSNQLATPITRSWTYDPKFSQLTSETDELGRTTSYQLDSRGNAIQITAPDPDGSGPLTDITTISYYSTSPTLALSGFVDTVTLPDPDGSLANGGGLLVAPKTKFHYDSTGRVVSVQKSVSPINQTLVTQESYNYNSVNPWLLKVKDAANRTALEYTTYNALGLPTTVKEAAGVAGVERQTVYEYDGGGHVRKLTQQDPDGSGPLVSPVYEFDYDSRGRLQETKAPAVSVIDSNGNTVIVQPTTTYDYDIEGNVSSITGPNGQVMTFVYDEFGRLTEERQPVPGATSGSSNLVTKYTYDERDRLTSRMVVDPANGSANLVHEVFRYDPLGRLLTQTDVIRSATTSYEYNADGTLKWVTDPLQRKTSYDYSVAGDLTKVTQPNPTVGSLTAGPVWNYGYDALGRLTSVKDPLHSTSTPRETKYEYNGLSQLTKVTSPTPGDVNNNVAQSMTYSYHSTGELASATNQSGDVTSYTYDALGRLLTTTYPAPIPTGTRQTTTNNYDRLGRLTSFVDQRGQTTSYSYNALSWLESETLPDPDGATGDRFLRTNLTSPVNRYFYDVNGDVRRVESPGPNSNTLTTNYQRDMLGNVTKVSSLSLGVSMLAVGVAGPTAFAVTQYDYDGLGRVKSVTDPFQQVVSYAYNDANRTVSVTQPGTNGSAPQVTTTGYDLVGNLTSIVDASGNTTQFQYDLLDRREKEVDPFGKELQYRYDAVGNLMGTTDRNGRRREFGYDRLDRVQNESWFNATGTNAVNVIRTTYDARGGETKGTGPFN